MWECNKTSKRTHQLLVGSPCLHCCSTKPSWPQTNPPSNWQNHRHSCKDRRVAPARWAQELARRSAAAVRLKGNRRGECGSTTPSYRLATCSRDQPRS